MVFIKQLKPRIFVQCNCCYTDWSLAFQGEGCGFESPPWDWKFFFFLAGLLTTDFDHKHSSGVYLANGSTSNFRFRGSIAKINILKEREGYSDRSGPRILEIDPVILKLSRFSQVKSERERTLVLYDMGPHQV